MNDTMDEFFDVTDDSGKKTGVVGSRKKVHELGQWHRTVHVWLLNRDGKILLQKRAADKESHPGMWDISAAGHILSGDSPEDTAVREVEEELGLKISKTDLEPLFSFRSTFLLNNGTYIDNEFVDVFMVKTGADEGSLDFSDGEVEAAQFVEKEDFFDRVDRRDPGLVPHWEEYEKLKKFL